MVRVCADDQPYRQWGFAHGLALAPILGVPDQPKGESVSLVENGLRFGFIFVDSLFGGVRALWANGGYVWPRARLPSLEFWGFQCGTVAVERRLI